MALRSTNDRYGSVAIAVHWLSAILIIGLLASGLRAAATLDPAAKAGLLRVHAAAGIAVLVLTLFRLAWWVFADRKPDPLSASRLMQRAAKSVHALFYVVILGMAASGIGMLVLSGAGPMIFARAGRRASRLLPVSAAHPARHRRATADRGAGAPRGRRALSPVHRARPHLRPHRPWKVKARGGEAGPRLPGRRVKLYPAHIGPEMQSHHPEAAHDPRTCAVR